MGLTNSSVGRRLAKGERAAVQGGSDSRIIALAGNPNVGKSTVFNRLTGMHQHTGNWPGKTVANAWGECTYNNVSYIMADIPGTYSLAAHSREEEIARDFICFGGAEAVVAVCDAVCLERNLNLVLQILEITDRVVVCVNLMDEAKKKNIKINLRELEKRLGVPVVGISAAKGEGLDRLMAAVERAVGGNERKPFRPCCTEPIERAAAEIEAVLGEGLGESKNAPFSLRWAALRLLEGDERLGAKIREYLGVEDCDEAVSAALERVRRELAEEGITAEGLSDRIISCTILNAEGLCNGVVFMPERRDRTAEARLDRILTGRITGLPAMLLLLAAVLWLTISGANYPSSLLMSGLLRLEGVLAEGAALLSVPERLSGMLIFGVYRVAAWVVSVMLPPMAIFFPLFTLLEDLGYLPRVAFNLDHCFKKCSACGKQALTMCMGFGCNAAGVTGARIIDSPRERLIAVLTNSLVPCNGRFPTIISIITMFFVFGLPSGIKTAAGALLLTAAVIFGILMTLGMSKLLSATILRGQPSSFTLELPPYRKPDIAGVMVRSVLDRTVFVLGRAVSAAAPAGAVIWLMANIAVGDVTLLRFCADFIDPAARVMGMDGIILLAFILGLPANETVVPIMLMAYMSAASITDMSDLIALKALLTANGWTWVTAVNVLLFSLLHWPCATTLLTIKKETGSLKWTAAAFLLPTAAGVLLCVLFTAAVGLIG